MEERPNRPRSSSHERDSFGRSRGQPFPPPRGPPPPSRRDDHRNRRPPDPPGRGRGDERDYPRHNDNQNRRRSIKSVDDERAWVAQRRRQRLVRKSLFDVPPTPEQALQDAQAASMTNFTASDFSGATVSMPQQTRHARRLYVGNLPEGMAEDELHALFRQAIDHASPEPLAEDPILSVYINQERRFCFLEFKTVEMTTACMALDGIDLAQKGKVKIKRPNDYNPAMAPDVHPTSLPKLDVSRLGIISGTVPDGPNKIFVGGLHYHLLESQILELLGAFGKVKAFHLVKSDPDAETSKGYCFVEYMDEALTQVAVAGLNGFDLGGNKVLTARIANAKDNELAPMPQTMATGTKGLPLGVYNVEELVDAAMGLRPMPTAPSLMGMPAIPLTPSTLTLPIQMPTVAAAAAAVLPPLAAPPAMSVMDIANLVEAATTFKSRILVLLNMVTDEDLATLQNHQDLSEEVKEECAKYGTLLSMKIPRPSVRLTCLVLSCHSKPAHEILSHFNVSPHRTDTSLQQRRRFFWSTLLCTMQPAPNKSFQGVNSGLMWCRPITFQKRTTGPTS